MTISILALGLLVGMQHAFEADHLAAVSAMLTRRRNLRQMTRLGALWGIGHTLALLVLSAVVLFSPWTLPPRFESTLELLVGCMLAFLGLRVIFRLWRDRVHIHVHEHDDGVRHLHAHSHPDEHSKDHSLDAAHSVLHESHELQEESDQPHAASPHHHRHPRSGALSLAVGLVHGAAGSAALVIFLAASLESATSGLLYVLVFGIGSIVGMVLLTVIVALPLQATATRATWLHRGLQVAMGLLAVVIGLRLFLHQLT